MINKQFLLIFIFNVIVLNDSSGQFEFRQIQNLSCDEKVNLHWKDQYFKIDSFDYKKTILEFEEYESAAVPDTILVQLDSIFEEAKLYLIDYMGQKNFCQYIFFSPKFPNFNGRKNGWSGRLEFDFSIVDSYGYITTNVDLVFRYVINSSGKVSWQLPNNMPNCTHDDCKFHTINIEKAMSIAQKSGYIQGNEELNFVLTKELQYRLSFATPFGFKSVYYDKDTHEIVDVSDHPTIANQSSSSLTELIERSDLIIDAQCIESITRKTKTIKNEKLVFQVNHVLKGKMDSLLVLDYKNSYYAYQIASELPWNQGIIFLKKDTISVLSDSMESDGWLVIGSSFSRKIPGYNYYTDIINGIHKQASDEALIRYRKPDVSIHRINETDQLNTIFPRDIKGTGIAQEINWLFWNETSDSLSFMIKTAALGIPNSLEHIETIIEYDTTSIGSFLVKNKKIQASFRTIQSRNSKETYYRRFLAAGYAYHLEDITFNRLKIVISHQAESQYSLIDAPTNIIKITIPITLDNDKDSIHLKLVQTQRSQYYDYFDGKIKDYNVSLSDTIQHKLSFKNAYPTIENFYPKIASPGDTITLNGKNLASYQDDINIYTSGINSRNLRVQNKYLKIPKGQIISARYNKLTFVLPASIDNEKRNLKDFKPINGRIRMYTISTDEELIIKH